MGQTEDPSPDERDTITLDLEDGTTIECIVIRIFDVDNEQYIALLPMNEEGGVDEDAQYYLYKFQELEGDDVDLRTIEDDDEYDKVSDYFSEILDQEEFDALFDNGL